MARFEVEFRVKAIYASRTFTAFSKPIQTTRGTGVAGGGPSPDVLLHAFSRIRHFECPAEGDMHTHLRSPYRRSDLSSIVLPSSICKRNGGSRSIGVLDDPGLPGAAFPFAKSALGELPGRPSAKVLRGPARVDERLSRHSLHEPILTCTRIQTAQNFDPGCFFINFL